MPIDYKALGLAVRSHRKAQRRSRPSLALLAGCHVNSLANLELAHGTPTLRTLDRVAQALGVEVASLLVTVPAPRAS